MQSASKQPQKLPRLIVALGVGQIIAWPSSYYLLAILALPMSRSTAGSSCHCGNTNELLRRL